MEVFSTITSPVFSELIIVLGGYNAITRLPREVTLFETLRKMSEVKPFKLAFLLVVLDPANVEPLRKFAADLDLVAVNGLLSFLDSPHTIRVVRSPPDPSEL